MGKKKEETWEDIKYPSSYFTTDGRYFMHNMVRDTPKDYLEQEAIYDRLQAKEEARREAERQALLEEQMQRSQLNEEENALLRSNIAQIMQGGQEAKQGLALPTDFFKFNQSKDTRYIGNGLATGNLVQQGEDIYRTYTGNDGKRHREDVPIYRQNVTGDFTHYRYETAATPTIFDLIGGYKGNPDLEHKEVESVARGSWKERAKDIGSDLYRGLGGAATSYVDWATGLANSVNNGLLGGEGEGRLVPEMYVNPEDESGKYGKMIGDISGTIASYMTGAGAAKKVLPAASTWTIGALTGAQQRIPDFLGDLATGKNELDLPSLTELALGLGTDVAAMGAGGAIAKKGLSKIAMAEGGAEKLSEIGKMTAKDLLAQAGIAVPTTALTPVLEEAKKEELTNEMVKKGLANPNKQSNYWEEFAFNMSVNVGISAGMALVAHGKGAKENWAAMKQDAAAIKTYNFVSENLANKVAPETIKQEFFDKTGYKRTQEAEVMLDKMMEAVTGTQELGYKINAGINPKTKKVEFYNVPDVPAPEKSTPTNEYVNNSRNIIADDVVLKNVDAGIVEQVAMDNGEIAWSPSTANNIGTILSRAKQIDNATAKEAIGVLVNNVYPKENKILTSDGKAKFNYSQPDGIANTLRIYNEIAGTSPVGKTNIEVVNTIVDAISGSKQPFYANTEPMRWHNKIMGEGLAGSDIGVGNVLATAERVNLFNRLLTDVKEVLQNKGLSPSVIELKRYIGEIFDIPPTAKLDRLDFQFAKKTAGLELNDILAKFQDGMDYKLKNNLGNEKYSDLTAIQGETGLKGVREIPKEKEQPAVKTTTEPTQTVTETTNIQEPRPVAKYDNTMLGKMAEAVNPTPLGMMQKAVMRQQPEKGRLIPLDSEPVMVQEQSPQFETPLEMQRTTEILPESVMPATTQPEMQREAVGEYSPRETTNLERAAIDAIANKHGIDAGTVKSMVDSGVDIRHLDEVIPEYIKREKALADEYLARQEEARIAEQQPIIEKPLQSMEEILAKPTEELPNLPETIVEKAPTETPIDIKKLQLSYDKEKGYITQVDIKNIKTILSKGETQGSTKFKRYEITPLEDNKYKVRIKNLEKTLRGMEWITNTNEEVTIKGMPKSGETPIEKPMIEEQAKPIEETTIEPAIQEPKNIEITSEKAKVIKEAIKRNYKKKKEPKVKVEAELEEIKPKTELEDTLPAPDDARLSPAMKDLAEMEVPAPKGKRQVEYEKVLVGKDANGNDVYATQEKTPTALKVSKEIEPEVSITQKEKEALRATREKQSLAKQQARRDMMKKSKELTTKADEIYENSQKTVKKPKDIYEGSEEQKFTNKKQAKLQEHQDTYNKIDSIAKRLEGDKKLADSLDVDSIKREGDMLVIELNKNQTDAVEWLDNNMSKLKIKSKDYQKIADQVKESEPLKIKIKVPDVMPDLVKKEAIKRTAKSLMGAGLLYASDNIDDDEIVGIDENGNEIKVQKAGTSKYLMYGLGASLLAGATRMIGVPYARNNPKLRASIGRIQSTRIATTFPKFKWLLTGYDVNPTASMKDEMAYAVSKGRISAKEQTKAYKALEDEFHSNWFKSLNTMTGKYIDVIKKASNIANHKAKLVESKISNLKDNAISRLDNIADNNNVDRDEVFKAVYDTQARANEEITHILNTPENVYSSEQKQALVDLRNEDKYILGKLTQNMDIKTAREILPAYRDLQEVNYLLSEHDLNSSFKRNYQFELSEIPQRLESMYKERGELNQALGELIVGKEQKGKLKIAKDKLDIARKNINDLTIKEVGKVNAKNKEKIDKLLGTKSDARKEYKTAQKEFKNAEAEYNQAKEDIKVAKEKQAPDPVEVKQLSNAIKNLNAQINGIEQTNNIYRTMRERQHLFRWDIYRDTHPYRLGIYEVAKDENGNLSRVNPLETLYDNHIPFKSQREAQQAFTKMRENGELIPTTEGDNIYKMNVKDANGIDKEILVKANDKIDLNFNRGNKSDGISKLRSLAVRSMMNGSDLKQIAEQIRTRVKDIDVMYDKNQVDALSQDGEFVRDTHELAQYANEFADVIERTTKQSELAGALEKFLNYTLMPSKILGLQNKNTQGWRPTGKASEWRRLYNDNVDKVLGASKNRLNTAALTESIEKQLIDLYDKGLGQTEYAKYMSKYVHDLEINYGEHSPFMSNATSKAVQNTINNVNYWGSAGLLFQNVSAGIKNVGYGTTAMALQATRDGIRMFEHAGFGEGLKAVAKIPYEVAVGTARGLKQTKLGQKITDKPWAPNLPADHPINEVMRELKQSGAFSATGAQHLSESMASSGHRVSKIGDMLYYIPRYTENIVRYDAGSLKMQQFADRYPYVEGVTNKQAWKEEAVNAIYNALNEVSGRYDMSHMDPITRAINRTPLGSMWLTLQKPAINQLGMVVNTVASAIQKGTLTKAAFAPLAGLLAYGASAMFVGGAEANPGAGDFFDALSALGFKPDLNDEDVSNVALSWNDRMQRLIKQTSDKLGLPESYSNTIFKIYQKGVLSTLTGADYSVDGKLGIGGLFKGEIEGLLMPMIISSITNIFTKDLKAFEQEGVMWGALKTIRTHIPGVGKLGMGTYQAIKGEQVDSKDVGKGSKYGIKEFITENVSSGILENRLADEASFKKDQVPNSNEARIKYIKQLFNTQGLSFEDLTGRDRDIETTYKNDPNMWKNATNIFWKVRDVIESPKFQKGIENSSEKIKDFISNNEKLIDAVAREDIKASSKKPSDYSEKYTSGSAKDVASFRKSLEQSVNQYYNLEARAQALESVGKKQYAVNKDFMEADLTDLVPKGKPLSKYPESERGYWYALYKFYKKKENTIPNY